MAPDDHPPDAMPDAPTARTGQHREPTPVATTTPSKSAPGALSASDNAGVSTELAVVVLGDQPAMQIEQAHTPPRERVLPGRAPMRSISYPVYMCVLVSALMAASSALSTREWSVWAVFIAWGSIYAWHWVYAIAWTYRRRLLYVGSLVMALGMTIGTALLCLDRAVPQWAARDRALVQRGALPLLRAAALLLLIAAVVHVAHVVWFGRGWRKKKPRR